MAVTKLPALASVLREVRQRHLDVPRDVVAAAQPYVTVAGPGLSVNFQFNPAHLAFQRLPFSHSSVPALYFHSVLDSLAEFAETPRLQNATTHGVRLKTAPMENFWDAVGELSTTYVTVFPPYGLNQAHPAMGAAELCQPSSRDAKDIRISLYDSRFHPMATMLLTGPHSRQLHGGAPSPPTGEARQMLAPEGDGATKEEGRPPTGGCNSATTNVWEETWLLGSLVSLPDGSFGHRVCIPKPAVPADVAPVDTEVPPWLVYTVVGEFCAKLAGAGVLHPSVVFRGGWSVVAHHTTSSGDLQLGAPFDVVCAPPKFFERYHLPPWKQRVGLPALRLGERPCVGLHVEMRQQGRAVLSGVYYLSLLDEA